MAIIDMDYTAENIHVLRTQGYAKLTPFFLPKIILNMPAGHVSIKFGLKVLCFALPLVLTANHFRSMREKSWHL